MKTPAKPAWAVFFDGHAPEYDDNVFTKNTLAEADFLERELGLSPGMAILDIGCGTGRHAVELARRGYRVTGVDLSEGMLAEARRKAGEAGVEVTWVQSDARQFAAHERFDAAVGLCEGAFGLLGDADDPIDQPLAILGRVSDALRDGAPCLFTVLNGYAIARRHSNEAVARGDFDPLTLAEHSEVAAEGEPLRERGFVPTELVLLFAYAGLEVRHIWGGTAGRWGRRPIDLDEIEIMVVARKTGPVSSSIECCTF